MTVPPVRTQRLAPLPVDQRSPEVEALLLKATHGTKREVNIYSTFVRNPTLYDHWLDLAHGLLFRGSIPPRERELVIMRVAQLCGCEYEWAQHRRFAGEAGVSESELRAVIVGPDDPTWSIGDALLLRAVDELHDVSCLSQETWDGLSSVWPEEQVIELIVCIGAYHLTAMMLNSFGVQLDDGLIGFDR